MTHIASYCFILDDELPDYVMVMVANKRTRGQMEEDLQLFLGDNTELFVNWLHQVLKKLQQVSVTAPISMYYVIKLILYCFNTLLSKSFVAAR